MEAKYKKLLWISIGLSLVALLVVILLTFDENTITNLSKLNGWFLLAAFGLHLLAIVFWGARILFLCRSLGYKVPLRHCINMAAAGQLLAAITPSSIGGEPIRVHELYKAKLPIADATAVVVVERLLEAVLLVLGVIVGMSAFSIIYSNGEVNGALIAAGWGGCAFFSLILIVLIFVLRKPANVKKWGVKIVGFFTKKMGQEKKDKLNTSIVSGVDQFYGTFRHFAGKARWGLAVGFLFSVLFWACEFSIASVIMVGLGFEPNILLSVVFQLIIAVILMIPATPGSTGLAEAVYGGFYSLLGLGNMLGPFVVLLRLILYYSNLIIGFIASFIIVRREARLKPVIPEEPGQNSAGSLEEPQAGDLLNAK